MLNVIWLVMILTAVVTGCFTGRLHEVILAAMESAKFAFNLAFGLTAVMCLWLGLLKIAEAAGLVALLTRALRPVLIRLFPEVLPEDPAMGAMTMNLAANMLGLGNAATPFGLKAMQALEKINPIPGIATNTMCTFVALHSSNLQIVPTTAIALLAVSGASHPTDIVLPLLLSSVCTVFTAVVVSKILGRSVRLFGRRVPEQEVL